MILGNELTSSNPRVAIPTASPEGHLMKVGASLFKAEHTLRTERSAVDAAILNLSHTDLLKQN